ncbi:MAG TPA: hypothetical protein VF725_08460, partial [Ktedonobacterales bacterium]
YAGVVALTRLARMSPMTRHDGPVSVRRAYSAAEARALATEAGLADAQVSVGFPYRLALTVTGFTAMEMAGDAERGAHAL